MSSVDAMNLNRRLLIGLVCATCLWPSPPKDLKKAEIRHWGPSHGLPEENVHAIAETADGYLWLASRDGLIRFDGLHFRVFNAGEASGFRDNGLGGVLVAGDSLWVGGRDYIAYAQPDTFHSFTNLRFRASAVPRDPQDRYGVSGMQADPDGSMFFWRADGIYRIQTNASYGQAPPVPQHYLPAPRGETMTGFLHQTGTDLAATESGIYRRQAGEWIPLPGTAIQAATLFRSRAGTLWAFGRDGLHKMDSAGQVKISIPGQIAAEAFRPIFEDRDGDIWVGLVGGVVRINRKGAAELLALDETMRSGDFVKVIYQTRDGAIWAASNWGALIRIDAPVFHTITESDGLGEVAIAAIARTHSGRTWIGTRSKGIYTQNGSRFQSVPDTSQGILHAIAPLGDDTLLYANVKGLWRHAPSGSTLLATAPSQVMNHYRSFSPNYGTHIYYNDSESIYRIPLPLQSTPRLEKVASVPFVRSMMEAPDGIWAISWESGLFHIDPSGEVTQYPLDERRELRGFTLFELSREYLMIGSSTGVLFFDRGKRQMLARPPLFDKDQIFHVLGDQRSHIWLAGRRALLATNRNTLIQYAQGRHNSILPLRLTGQQGLSSTNFGLGTSSVGTIDEGQTMWLASVGGAIHFRPSDVIGLDEELPCAIATIIADGAPLAFTGAVSLPPGVRRLEIQYAVLNRQADRNPIFRYRLEGDSPDWIETSLTQADFTNLAPASYRFQVQARSAALEWSAPATIAIDVEPQWFQRNSVRLGAAGLLALLLWLTVRLRSRAITARNLELEDRVRTRTEELAQARDEAESAVRAKAQFLAAMSHEIRTPMNGVIGMVEVLKQTPLNAEQQHMLSVVSESGEALIGILNDVLDFSKIEAGALSLESAPFDLHAVVRQCHSLFAPQAAAKSLGLSVAVDPGVPVWVRGDSGRLRQILLNLLSNALKFTPQGDVGLRVHPSHDNAVCFAVSDTGIGIPPDKLQSIFGAFTQAESDTTRRFGGTGLGLSISQRLAMAMQGSLTVRSTPGQGSEFQLTIPLPETAAASARPAGSEKEMSPRRVLVVEDNAVNRQVASRLLTNLGCQVTLANDGLEGVYAVSQEEFDVVLMDCHMPGMDGFEATRQIRALMSIHQPPHIVALTADAMPEDRQRCFDAGMNGFLTKPIRREELLRLLESVPVREVAP